MSTGGGRQEVSGDELRLLADSAAQTSFDVAALRQRVQDIVNGVDRRGWNAGAFDEQWGQTRFGLGMLATELEDNHQELLVRSDEADLLNTREFIAGAIVLADTDPALGFGPGQVATWPTIAPNPDVDWSQVVALGPSDFNQFATPYSDIDLSPEP